MHRHRVALVLALLASLGAAQPLDLSLVGGMGWRNIGPSRGGRSVACSGVPGSPAHFYMGSCGGGLWKSEDSGESWKNVSDGYFGTGTVGAIAVSPSRPETVYVGTGESPIRGNVSHGDGVYKSVDAGKTWSHVGLRATETVSRIVIHPTNPETVWVGALGPVFGPGTDRGVYKSTDGGKSWKRTLAPGPRTGIADLCLDPNDPKILYASSWDGWRTPWSMNSGGPGSRLWKSTDGGETWADITANAGLPKGVWGRVGVSASRAKPGRVWAMVENAEGGLFLSDDSGSTWTKKDAGADRRQRPWYYMRVEAHPTEPDTVYVLNVVAYRSKDLGKTFLGFVAGHSDHHDIWIDPSDPKRHIVSSDGGASVSVDDGRAWSELDFPTSQIYHVSTDDDFPYRVLGAQQDNSTIRIASRTSGALLGEDDWTSTAGGESGFVVAKPGSAHIVVGGSYGGDLSVLDHRTNQTRSMDVWPDNPMGHGAADLKERFQWTFPIAFSRHDPTVVYTCSQHVHRSTDMGKNWTRLSGDLTRNDRSKMGPSGGPVTKDNTSVEYYGTIFAFAESPLTPSVLWTGSDDGRVHISRDAGESWKDVTPKSMPEWGQVASVEPSWHREGTAFAAVNRNELGDRKPYVFMTTDFGATWRRIELGLPEECLVRVVREDPVVQGLLFCGSETGFYASLDDGATWREMRLNLPITPVHDIAISGSDVVVATHGRAFWILDDISPLRQAAEVTAGDSPWLYRPSDAVRARWGAAGLTQVGANPMSGIIVDYVIRKKAEKVELEFADAEGAVLATMKGNSEIGHHRASTTLRYPGYKSVPGLVFWGAGPGPIKAPPGRYTVTLVVDGVRTSRDFRLVADPRSNVTLPELVAQFELSRAIVAKVDEANGMVVKLRAVADALDKSKVPSAAALAVDVKSLRGRINQDKSRVGQDPLNYPIMVNNRLAALIGVVQTGDTPPSRQAYAVLDALSIELKALIDEAGQLLGPRLDAVNKEIAAAGGEQVVVPSG